MLRIGRIYAPKFNAQVRGPARELKKKLSFDYIRAFIYILFFFSSRQAQVSLLTYLVFQLLASCCPTRHSSRPVSHASKRSIPENFVNFSKREVFEWARNAVDLNEKDARAFREANISANALMSMTVTELNAAGLSMGTCIDLFKLVKPPPLPVAPVTISIEMGKKQCPESAKFTFEGHSDFKEFLTLSRGVGLMLASNSPSAEVIIKFGGLVNGAQYRIVYPKYDLFAEVVEEQT